jgi:hypothetical protein
MMNEKKILKNRTKNQVVTKKIKFFEKKFGQFKKKGVFLHQK